MNPGAVVKRTYTTLISTLRREKKAVLIVPSTGIAANLLPVVAERIISNIRSQFICLKTKCLPTTGLG